MQAANHVLLTTQLDLPCLRNVVRLMMSFGEIDGLKEKIKIVVNRAGLDSGQISLKKAQETMGRDIFWQLPNDYRTMVEVRNNGVPLVEQAPKAPITQSIIELADALIGDAKQPAAADAGGKAGPSRWLSFWAASPRRKSFAASQQTVRPQAQGRPGGVCLLGRASPGHPWAYLGAI